ncbi:DUF87 domain-containing protein [soil metagenome]
MAALHVGGGVDPSTHERTGETTELRSEDFTTHGVIVGMTGSGKTGLGLVLVEEVLRAGIPALLIDPKGDLTNLCLTFPHLAADEFLPWVDETRAQAAGVSPADFAAADATRWTDGLAGWGYGTEQIVALRTACDVTVYTPGSQTGEPMNVIGSLRAPPTDDREVIDDEIEGFVTGLLGLVGVDADPLSSREHILMSNLVHNAWAAGRYLDLAALVGQVQDPPLRKLGVLELDEFFPADDRRRLAMQLNGLLASPAFAAWGLGPPLDIESMLRRPDGRPRCAIVTTAHLTDAERQFVTSLVLSKLVTWMRRQSGTTDLRALLYMDEVMGYLPPTAMPATKKPIMTLMKTARAFGVGVVLATQNPVDIDYQAIANAGTWMIGRLQTEQDKTRLLDGMAAAAGTVDISAVGDTVSGLTTREFVLRRAGKDQPEVFTTRWAMSYLRGPLTRDQIKQLRSGDAPAPDPASEGESGITAGRGTGADDTTSVMPKVADDVTVRWVSPGAAWLADIGGDVGGTAWEPAVIARTRLRYDETKADLVHDVDVTTVLFPLDGEIDVSRGTDIDVPDADLRSDAPDGAVYRLTDAPLGVAKTWKQIERNLTDHLWRDRTMSLLVNKPMKLSSTPGETAEAFRARCLAAATTAATTEKAEASARHALKTSKLADQRDAAADRADVVAEQAKERKRSNLLRAAGDVLSGVLGSRRSAAGRIGRAAERLTRNSDDKRAEEAQNKVDRLDARHGDLDAVFVAEVAAIEADWTAKAGEITELTVGLERTDVDVVELILAWVPVP